MQHSQTINFGRYEYIERILHCYGFWLAGFAQLASTFWRSPPSYNHSHCHGQGTRAREGEGDVLSIFIILVPLMQQPAMYISPILRNPLKIGQLCIISGSPFDSIPLPQTWLQALPQSLCSSKSTNTPSQPRFPGPLINPNCSAVVLPNCTFRKYALS